MGRFDSSKLPFIQFWEWWNQLINGKSIGTTKHDNPNMSKSRPKDLLMSSYSTCQIWVPGWFQGIFPIAKVVEILNSAQAAGHGSWVWFVCWQLWTLTTLTVTNVTIKMTIQSASLKGLEFPLGRGAWNIILRRNCRSRQTAESEKGRCFRSREWSEDISILYGRETGWKLGTQLIEDERLEWLGNQCSKDLIVHALMVRSLKFMQDALFSCPAHCRPLEHFVVAVLWFPRCQ